MINPQIMLSMVTNRIIHYECLLGEHWLLKYLNASLVNLSRPFYEPDKERSCHVENINFAPILCTSVNCVITGSDFIGGMI